MERFTFPPVDSIRAEIDAFARAIPQQGRATEPYPITVAEMVQGIGLFEGIVRSIETRQSTGIAS